MVDGCGFHISGGRSTVYKWRQKDKLRRIKRKSQLVGGGRKEESDE